MLGWGFAGSEIDGLRERDMKGLDIQVICAQVGEGLRNV